VITAPQELAERRTLDCTASLLPRRPFPGLPHHIPIGQVTTSITTSGDVGSPHRLLPFDHTNKTAGRSIRVGNSEGSTMSEISTANEAGRYEIRLKGHLDSRWATWFDGLTLTTNSDGTTTIHGIVVDQSALHGLLQKVRDIGLPLISVTRVEPMPTAPPTSPV
jgi:hypothetical protein